MNNEIEKQRIMYLFIDEGGNLDFSPGGTQYFTITSVASARPFIAQRALEDLRYDLIEEGWEGEDWNGECFHATEDRQDIRNRVFGILEENLPAFRADSVIVEKAKTHPSLWEMRIFYPRILGYLLKYVIDQLEPSRWDSFLIITDSLPHKKKRKAIEHAIKGRMVEMLPPGTSYKIFHHESKSSIELQIADYFNWAIYRAWSTGDQRSLDRIRPAVKSQFDIFRRGNMLFY